MGLASLYPDKPSLKNTFFFGLDIGSIGARLLISYGFIPQPTLMTIIQQLSTLTMELDPKKDDAGDYIDDFRQSDAPQFKGKSDAKIRKMAIAAYLDAKDKK